RSCHKYRRGSGIPLRIPRYPPHRPAFMKPKILVVDDEPDALEVLGFKLREAGFTPIFADDGAGALTAVRAEKPDLIVLDLMLPEIDGLEVCKILRRDPTTA